MSQNKLTGKFAQVYFRQFNCNTGIKYDTISCASFNIGFKMKLEYIQVKQGTCTINIIATHREAQQK